MCTSGSQEQFDALVSIVKEHVCGAPIKLHQWQQQKSGAVTARKDKNSDFLQKMAYEYQSRICKYMSRPKSKSNSKLKGLFYYTGDAFFYVEYCIRQP